MISQVRRGFGLEPVNGGVDRFRNHDTVVDAVLILLNIVLFAVTRGEIETYIAGA
jgi:hypothetical protein